MSNKQPNDTSVRIPAKAHAILFTEKVWLLKEGKKVGIGTLAGLYIERAELLEEALDVLRHTRKQLERNTLSCVEIDRFLILALP